MLGELHLLAYAGPSMGELLTLIYSHGVGEITAGMEIFSRNKLQRV